MMWESTEEMVVEIEARAKALDLPIARLCRDAEVSNSTWTRLKSGKIKSSRMETIARIYSALERFSKKQVGK